MLMTPVTRLRKDAPGSLTAADVAAFLTKRKLPRRPGTVTAFERGQIRTVPERFVELYAEAIGSTKANVLAAHAATLRMRDRKSGPFRP